MRWQEIFKRWANGPEPPRKQPDILDVAPQSVSSANAILDPRSQSWIHVLMWAEERLQKTRLKNDNPNNDIAQTSVLRGEIKVLRALIDLPKPKPGRGLLVDED